MADETTTAEDKATDVAVVTADKDASKVTDEGEDLAGMRKALKAARSERDALSKAARDAELARLPELDQAKTVAAELTKSNEKLQHDNARMRVALELGMDWALAKRLAGDTPEELLADGRELMAKFAPKAGDGTRDDPANRRKATTTNDAGKKGASGGSDMNAVLRGLAGR